jgi:hypothetical protein
MMKPTWMHTSTQQCFQLNRYKYSKFQHFNVLSSLPFERTLFFALSCHIVRMRLGVLSYRMLHL